MDDFFIALPKVELHAHLSGSVSHATLRRLTENHCSDKSNNASSLDWCFRTFSALHEIINTTEKVKSATTDVVEEFCSDGVVYLELRTTLRPLPSLEDYLDAVISGVLQSPSVIANLIDVRILLSIDRTKGCDLAQKTTDMLIHYGQRWPNLFVGLDVSGNPRCGTLLDFVPLLEQARKNNFRTTVHLAEIPQQEDEWWAFLQLHVPDRIGHGTCLPRPGTTGTPVATRVSALIQMLRIPIEVCLTSNVVSNTVKDFEFHHAPAWIRNGHPICICTDDKGLFDCTLSGELQALVKRCGVHSSQLRQIIENSIAAAFCSDSKKTELAKKVALFFDSDMSLQ